MTDDLRSIVTATTNGASIQLRVVPRAGRSSIAGIRDGALLVRVAAPPVDGAANDALVDLLAAAFGVPRREVQLVSGEHSRSKRVIVHGLDAEAVRAIVHNLVK
jgi:uncharacterized protein